jgi:hypothetical protein
MSRRKTRANRTIGTRLHWQTNARAWLIAARDCCLIVTRRGHAQDGGLGGDLDLRSLMRACRGGRVGSSYPSPAGATFGPVPSAIPNAAVCWPRSRLRNSAAIGVLHVATAEETLPHTAVAGLRRSKLPSAAGLSGWNGPARAGLFHIESRKTPNMTKKPIRAKPIASTWSRVRSTRALSLAARSSLD